MPGMLRKTFAVLAVLAAFATTSAMAQQAEEARFAFVIGNDLYQDAPLPTAANDAGLIADTLKSAGFDVTGARNLDQDTLRSSYREFLEKVAAAGPDAVALIYLSGYGLQFKGDNYLVPAGAQVARESDIPLNAVRLSDLTQPLAGLQAKAKIAIFDLAHPFSLARAPGLALIDPDPGMLVAMNAAPGTVGPTEAGPYGAYAQALAEMIGTPGLPIGDVFDQVRLRVAALTKGAEVPWDTSRIDQPFVFFAAGPDTPPPPVTAAEIETRLTRPIRSFSVDDAYAAALERDTLQGYADFLAAYPTSRYAKSVRGLLAARREALTWRHTLDVGTPDAYWSYLRRYPKGPHAAEARETLGQLAAALQPSPDFAPLDYDVPPPPPDEEVYFDAPQPVFYDSEYAPPPPPVIFLPPPPPWWVPPPPPRIDRDNVYFLPGFEHREEPGWQRPPPYVVAPPEPHYEHGAPPPGERIIPYVAIPAALAVGIATGRLLKGKTGPQGTALPGQPPRGTPLIPPVTAPPRGPGHPGPAGHLPPPGGQPLPGAGYPNPPPSHPAAGLPPAGGQPLPGAGHPKVPPGHPAAGLPPPPGGQPLPGTGQPKALPRHPAAGLPPPPSGQPLPGAGHPKVPAGHPNPPPPAPKIVEPPPPRGPTPPRPQPQLRTVEPPPPRINPQPQVRTVVQPHVAPPAPPPPHPAAPPPRRPEPSASCGHPGQPACK
jgi:uncharacterized caspase-like protein